MKIKAIGFDIGGTLVNYNKPLNWSASYKPALEFMCEKNQLEFNEERFEQAKEILTKYNTRINPREIEVSSDVLFGEIFDKWNENKEKDILGAKAVDMGTILINRENKDKMFSQDYTVTTLEEVINIIE